MAESIAEMPKRPCEQVAVRPSSLAAVRASLLLPGMLTGLLLWLCYFPVAWGWLGWVALVPLVSLVRRPVTKRQFFIGSWVGGLLFYLPALQWMRVADHRMYATWLGLTLYCSLYFPLALGLARYLDRRSQLSLVFTLPVIWTALELLRAHFGTGFPWYFLGHTQHDCGAVIQIADLTGVYGVSFVVVAVNVLLFELLCRWRPFANLFGLPEVPAGPRPLLVPGIAVGVLLVLTLAYGTWRLGQNDFAPGPRVALVQSNLPQSVRNAASQGNFNNLMLEHNTRLTDRAILMRPDLIVWPETSHPDCWMEVAPEVPARQVPAEFADNVVYSCQQARDLSRRWPTHLLLGLNSEVLTAPDRTRFYNSALLIAPGGQPAGRYDKIHRVPFGEYVPLRDWLPFMNWFAPYDFDYSTAAGERFTRFPLHAYRFGVVICYEDSDPCLARAYVSTANGEPGVDFLINISNDGWFKGSSEHEEHLALSRFRAVECRRAVIRAVNMGISAVIDPNGRVLPPEVFRREGEMTFWGIRERDQSLPLSRWREFKSAAGVLAAMVPIDHRSSLYAQWGDWLPWLCWLVLAAAIVKARFR